MQQYLKLISMKTKLKCLGVLFLAIIGSIFASLWPLQLGKICTEISNGSIISIAQGAINVVGCGLIYLSAECITIIRRVILDCIVATHEAEIREKSVEKLLKMPVSYYYSGELNGEKTAQLNQGVTGLSQLVKIFCNDIFATILIAVCTLTQVVINAPRIIAIIILMYLGFTIGISVWQIRSQNGIRENIISQKNALDGQICQSIANIEPIRCMNAEDSEKQRLKPDICNISLTEKKHHKYMGRFDCAKQVGKIVFLVVILLISVQMIAKSKMASGTVITIYLLYQQLVKPIDEIYRFMDETTASIVKAKALIEVFSSNEDLIFSIKNSSKVFKDPDIIIKNIIIQDPNKQMSIANFDYLHIPGNKIVALVGDSGCGKTTLIRCLNRYFPYMSGSIRLFGYDLDIYSQYELTKEIFYVPQKTFFFAGTIRDNLIYGLKRKVSEEELLDALQNACLLDVLIHKVGGTLKSDMYKRKSVLDYCVGEGGTGLSGGEGQRLSIARAFLRKPHIFIFDESTANLDYDTTEKILKYIELYANKIKAGIIYISHDKNVIKRCDEVIYLDNKVKLLSKRNEVA